MKHFITLLVTIAVACTTHGANGQNCGWTADRNQSIQQKSPTKNEPSSAREKEKERKNEKNDDRPVDRKDNPKRDNNKRPCVDPKPDREPTVLY